MSSTNGHNSATPTACVILISVSDAISMNPFTVRALFLEIKIKRIDVYRRQSHTNYGTKEEELSHPISYA